LAAAHPNKEVGFDTHSPDRECISNVDRDLFLLLLQAGIAI
jgi:hypothetical protein